MGRGSGGDLGPDHMGPSGHSGDFGFYSEEGGDMGGSEWRLEVTQQGFTGALWLLLGERLKGGQGGKPEGSLFSPCPPLFKIIVKYT